MKLSRANEDLYWCYEDKPYRVDCQIDGDYLMRLYRLYSESEFAPALSWLKFAVAVDDAHIAPFAHGGSTIVRVSFARRIDALRFLLEFA